MKIAFLLNDVGLSGGAIVALRHASRLGGDLGHDVSVVTIRGRSEDWVRREFPDLSVVSLDDLGNLNLRFDVAIATFWETLFSLERIDSSRYVWFAQSLEDRFYSSENPIGDIAAAAMQVPIAVVTEARWIRDLLCNIDPGRAVHVARNGIDKEIFTADGRQSRASGDPLRVLIEGELGRLTKDVESSIRGVLDAKTCVTVSHITAFGACSDDSRYGVLPGPLSFHEMADAFRSHDVLVKTSRVEGMYGPPLESLHCGCTVITTPVTGHDEFIVDDVNSIVVGWDDPRAIGSALDLLNNNRELLDRLADGGLETATRWPSLAESTAEFESALLACLSVGSSETDRAILAAFRAIRSLRLPQVKMHVRSVQTDRALHEQRAHAHEVDVERDAYERALLSEIDAMRATVSWRVTAPIRMLRRFR